MKSGIELDSMLMRLPGHSTAGAEARERTAPAWQREMERAQMEAWLCHSMVGFANPTQLPLMPGNIAATDAAPPPQRDAVGKFHKAVLPAEMTVGTGGHGVQERAIGITVDRSSDRAYPTEGSHIDRRIQVQVAATGVNGRGRDQVSIEASDPSSNSGVRSRTHQLMSLLQGLGTVDVTISAEQRPAIDAASPAPARATPAVRRESVWSEPATLARSPAALIDKLLALDAAPQPVTLAVAHPTVPSMPGGMPGQWTGRHMCVDDADQAASVRGDPRGATREPVRVHADWSAEGLHLWLGMDASHLASLDSLNAQLQRWLSTQGLKLLSMSVNGRVIEQADQKSDSDVYDADAEQTDAEAAPAPITPTLKEFP